MAYIGKSPIIGNFVKLDAITAVNGQAAYTMQNGGSNFTDYESVNQFLVSLNGTIQAPTDSFTVSGSTLTFASNLATGDVIDFIMVFGNSLSAGVPTDATVTTAKIVDGAITSAKLASGVGGVAGITSSADATAITITSDEKVGIGTTSPTRELTVGNTANARIEILSSDNSAGASQLQFGDPDNSQIGRIYYEHSDNSMRFYANNSEFVRIDSSGDLQFNSGFGSLKTAFGVRAWVVFDGNTGNITNSGNAEGNVSSVTRHGTGNYTVNFTNAMPDTEYTVTGSTVGNSYGTRETFLTGDGGLKATSSVDVQVHDRGSSFVDNNRVNVNVVR